MKKECVAYVMGMTTQTTVCPVCRCETTELRSDPYGGEDVCPMCRANLDLDVLHDIENNRITDEDEQP